MMFTLVIPLLALSSTALASLCTSGEIQIGKGCITEFEQMISGVEKTCINGSLSQADQLKYLIGRATGSTGTQFENYLAMIEEKINTCSVAFPLQDFKMNVEDGLQGLQPGYVNQSLELYSRLFGTEKQEASDILRLRRSLENLTARLRASCSKRDLTESMGPRKDQVDSSLCYAVAISDLIYEKTRMQPSYIDLGLQYHLAKSSAQKPGLTLKDLDYGNITPMLNIALQNGVCEASSLPDNRFNFDRIKSTLDFLSRPPPVGTEGCRGQTYAGVPFDQVENLWRISQNISLSYSSEFIKRACSQRTSLPETLKAAPIEEPFMDGIDAALAEENPVAIGGKLGRAFSGHAVTVIGRDWDNEKRDCVYKIRDNYGSRCPVDGHLECKDGYFYISRNELKNSVHEAVYIERNGP